MLRTPKLPKEHIEWLTNPFQRFLHIETTAALMLGIFTLSALLISNSSWATPFLSFWETSLSINIGVFDFTRSFLDLINDGAMTLFFFVIALELKRELVLGELHQPRVAALSISAALGGMFIPALFYWFFMSGHSGQNAWGTVMATDTAFAIGCLSLLGKRIPKNLRIFMLSLAVIDDIGAILVVGIGYTQNINWSIFTISIFGFAIIRLMNFLGIRNFPCYFFIGVLIWFTIDAAGIHATITGVILGLMTPTTKLVSDKLLHDIFKHIDSYPSGENWSRNISSRKALQTAQAAAREILSPLERLEVMLHPWVGYIILPLFAFANAGITINSLDLSSRITLATFLGFVLGKPVGVFLFAWLAVKARLAKLSSDLSWQHLAGASLLAGIGFTMAIFIADLALSKNLLNEAKLGILSASIVCALLGMVILLTTKKAEI